MAVEDNKSNDFYAILGLKKECTAVELRIAYKKLALKWHPDRCTASGNSKYVEEAKRKFQAIQQAYSVLSDANKRFLYDVGVYDCNDHEDESGMGDFLNEMAEMMSQNDSNDNGEDSFGELQELFDEMFQSDIEAFHSSRSSTPTACSSSSYGSINGISSASNKRNSSEISSGNLKGGGTQFEGFCMGVCPLTMLHVQTNCTDGFIESQMATFRWILDRKTKLKQSIKCCHSQRMWNVGETPVGRKQQEEEECPQGPEVVGGTAMMSPRVS